MFRGAIEAAGGFHVHALPGADPEEVRMAEENVRGFPGPGELVREGHDAEGIVNRLLAGLGQRLADFDFDRDHWFFGTQSGTSGCGEHNISNPPVFEFIKKRIHNLSRSCCNPAGPQMNN